MCNVIPNMLILFLLYNNSTYICRFKFLHTYVQSQRSTHSCYEYWREK